MGAIASRQLSCLFRSLLRVQTQKLWKVCITLCERNPPVTGGSPDKGPIVLKAFPWHDVIITWWSHQMETFSALLAIYGGNSTVPGEFPTQIWARINGWVKNREADDLRRHRAHHDVIIIYLHSWDDIQNSPKIEDIFIPMTICNSMFIFTLFSTVEIYTPDIYLCISGLNMEKYKTKNIYLHIYLYHNFHNTQI